MSAVLAFPQRNKGRIRKSCGQDSMGRLALMQLERFGGTVPSNVALIDQPAERITQSPELLLALACYGALDTEQKEKVHDTISTLAYGRGCHHAIKLNDLLKQR